MCLDCNNSLCSLVVLPSLPISTSFPNHLLVSFSQTIPPFVDLCALASLVTFLFSMSYCLFFSALFPPGSFFSFSFQFLSPYAPIYVLPYQCVVRLPAYFVSVASLLPLPPFLPSSFPSVFPSFLPPPFSPVGVCLSGDDHRVQKRRLL